MRVAVSGKYTVWMTRHGDSLLHDEVYNVQTSRVALASRATIGSLLASDFNSTGEDSVGWIPYLFFLLQTCGPCSSDRSPAGCAPVVNPHFHLSQCEGIVGEILRSSRAAIAGGHLMSEYQKKK